MPEVEWSSKGAERVIKDFENVAKATERNQNAIKGTTKATEEMGRIAQKIIKDNETSWERWTRQVTNAKIAADNQKISVTQMSREHARATVELLREVDAVDKNTAARNRSMAVRRQQQKLAEAMRLETLRGVSTLYNETQAVGQMGVELGNHAMQARKVFGAWSNIASMARTLGPALGGALGAGAVYGGMREQDARLASAGDRAIESSRAGAGLAELSRGDQGKLRELKGASRTSFLEGGFTNEADAHALTFELESGGMLGERGFFSKAERAGQPSAQLAKTVATYRQGFVGGDPVGTSQEIVSKAIEAAAEPVGVEASDILAGASLSAANAKRLGLTDEEHLGVISTIADVTADASRAGTFADSLYRAFIRRGYVDKNKKSITELRDELASKGLVHSKLQKELGREEASAAFSLVSEPGRLEERIGKISAAQSTGQADRVFDMRIADTAVSTGIQQNRQRAKSQVQMEENGLRAVRVRSMREAEADWDTNNLWSPLAWARSVGRNIGTTIMPDSWEDPGVPAGPATGTGDVSAELLEEAKKANAQRDRQLRLQERRGIPMPSGRKE